MSYRPRISFTSRLRVLMLNAALQSLRMRRSNSFQLIPPRPGRAPVFRSLRTAALRVLVGEPAGLPNVF